MGIHAKMIPTIIGRLAHALSDPCYYMQYIDLRHHASQQSPRFQQTEYAGSQLFDLPRPRYCICRFRQRLSCARTHKHNVADGYRQRHLIPFFFHADAKQHQEIRRRAPLHVHEAGVVGPYGVLDPCVRRNAYLDAVGRICACRLCDRAH